MLRNVKYSFVSMLLIFIFILGMIPVSAVSTETIENLVNFTDLNNPSNAEQGNIIMNADVLRYVNEEEFLSNNYAERLSDLEDLNTFVFQKEDGTRAVYMFDENVKYVDSRGLIREKDITLIKKGNGYTTKSNDVYLNIPETIDEGIVFKIDNYEMILFPNTETGIKGENNNNSVSYSGVFGNGTVLKYTPTISGMKEDIVIEEKPEEIDLSFRIKTNGLCLYNNDGKLFFAEKEDSETRIILGEVVVYDALGNPIEGFIDYSVITEGEEYNITLVVDDILNDPETIFPVRVDPSLTVSNGTHGTGTIIDAPIYQSKPNYTCSAFDFNTVGTYNSLYGVGRTVVKLPGLTSLSLYQSLSANQITSVKFCVKENSSTSSSTINIYPIINVTTWSQNYVTWNMIGNNYSSTLITSDTLTDNNWTEFNITNLVKGWKNGTYNPECGFIMINSNESADKSFASCENSNGLDRPYIILSYTLPIEISAPSLVVTEGGTLNLTATTNPSGLTVTWSSSNTNIATVNSNGVVTGIRSRQLQVIITASVTISGNTYSDSRYIYVVIPDGVYKIQNDLSYYFLTVDGGVGEHTSVVQYDETTSASTMQERLSQLWKVKHVGSGRYSIRPMCKPDMGLTITYTYDGEIDTIGLNDDLSIEEHSLWEIERVTYDGYLLCNCYDDDFVLYAEDDEEGTPICVGLYNNTSGFIWYMVEEDNPPNGLLLYNNSTASDLIMKYVAPYETRTLSQQSLSYAVYSGMTLSQDVTWSSSNTAIATVDSVTGAVTGVSPGTVTITASTSINGITYTASYTLVVTLIRNGIYYIRNSETYKCIDIENHILSNGSYSCQWEQLSDDYQKWEITHVGDGYYTIRSYESNSYYLGVQNNSSANGSSIVLRTGAVQNGMKWKIDSTLNAYKLTAKSGESYGRVLSVGSSLPTQNGTRLYQQAYTNDTNYLDEWSLEVFVPLTFNLLGITNTGHNHQVALNAAVDYLDNRGYSSDYVSLYTGSMTGSECKAFILSANIFTSRSHGVKSFDPDTNLQRATGLKLTDIQNSYKFYSHPWSGWASGSESFYSTDDLSDLYLALFVGCDTGYGGSTALNLPKRAVELGAKCAIGFSDSINCPQANDWTDAFYSGLLSGYSVLEAINYARTQVTDCILKYPVVCGDDSYRIINY